MVSRRHASVGNGRIERYNPLIFIKSIKKITKKAKLHYNSRIAALVAKATSGVMAEESPL